jgi:cytochrome c-type biogenesis protein CcmH/NrfG
LSPLDERSARAALDQARPVIARLGDGRDPEDNAADIIEGWGAVETALRSLLGGTSLSGQALVRELRQREQLGINEAHAVLAFLGARDRAGQVDYRPSTADVAAARDGFGAVEGRLLAGAPAAATTSYAPLATPGHASRIADVAASGGDYAPPTTTGARSPLPFLALALGGLIAVVGVAVYFSTRGSDNAAFDKGLELFKQHSPVAAQGYFQQAVQQHPQDVRARVYLARTRRDNRDTVGARNELATAIQLDPNSQLALREMGTLLLAQNQNTLARNFLVRAVAVDTLDRDSKGFLGCALARLGSPEADKWLQRGGPGVWQQCAASARAPRVIGPNGVPIQPGARPGTPF